jgi:GNAT superfamily N-acetyltransferase
MERKLFRHRPFSNSDIQSICSFPQSEEELFYFFPKAVYPLTPEQLQIAIDQRSDSTVVEIDGDVAGFANFYRWNDRKCCIGNLVVAPLARGQGVATYLIQTMIHLASIKHAAPEYAPAFFQTLKEVTRDSAFWRLQVVFHNQAIKFAAYGRQTIANTRCLWQRYTECKKDVLSNNR